MVSFIVFWEVMLREVVVSFIVFWEVMLRGFHCVLGGYVSLLCREVLVFHCVLGGYVERGCGLSLCFGRLC